MAEYSQNETVLTAAILHDALDNYSITYDILKNNFGSKVADLLKSMNYNSYCIEHFNNKIERTTFYTRSGLFNNIKKPTLEGMTEDGWLIKLSDIYEHLKIYCNQDVKPYKARQSFMKDIYDVLDILKYTLRFNDISDKYSQLIIHINEHLEKLSHVINTKTPKSWVSKKN